MVSFRVQKKLGPRPDRSPLGGLIQNFRRASPLFSYAKCPPPPSLLRGKVGRKMHDFQCPSVFRGWLFVIILFKTMYDLACYLDLDYSG